MQRALAWRAAGDGNIEPGIVENWAFRIAVLADPFADELINFQLLAGNDWIGHRLP